MREIRTSGLRQKQLTVDESITAPVIKNSSFAVIGVPVPMTIRNHGCVGGCVFKRVLRLAAFGLAFCGYGILCGQNQLNERKLAFVIPNLYGPFGLRLENPGHNAHFDSSFQENFGPFNSAVASQLTSLPIPSPASGFTYTFDPKLGVYERSARTFGPILAERAETLGKDRFYFGFAFQQFGFEQLDEVNLENVPVVFTHSRIGDPKPVFLKDVVSTRNLVDLRIGQFTSFFSYGLTDSVDVSVALPVISATLDVASAAKIQRLGTDELEDDDPDRLAHTFRFKEDVSDRRFVNGSSASGLGDVILRLKGTVAHWERAALALAADVRFPTGDELKFLGTGAVGFKPFLIFSYNRRISPHFNVGYQFNGKSILGGDVGTGQKGDLPDQFLYSAGVDVGVTPKFSLAADFLGQRIIDAQRVSLIKAVDAADQPGQTGFETIAFSRRSVETADAAFGFKLNPARGLLVTYNLIVKLNQGGLRSRVTPLIGVSFTP